MRTAPTTPTLANVKVGDYVWLDASGSHFGAMAHSYVREITHISPSGRLFICQPSSDGINSFRYGFHPETGKAQYRGYGNLTMRYATPAEVATELARVAAENAAVLAVEKKLVQEKQVRNTAPQLLAACKAALPRFVVKDTVDEAALALLIAAIAEAEKEVGPDD